MSPPSEASNACRGLSINQLAQRHCRERLLVPPLYWTERQLELLRCSFDDAVPASPIASYHFTGERNGAKFIGLLVKRTEAFFREQGIVGLIASDECPLLPQRNLRFVFNRRARFVLKCTWFLLRQQPKEPAVALYVDQKRIQLLREDALSPQFDYRFRAKDRNKQFNAAQALYIRRLEKLTPHDPTRDPYIVALLITMAQEALLHGRAHGIYNKGESSPSSILAKILVSFPKRDSVYLYAAHVPCSLLDMFFEPAVPPISQPSLFIRTMLINLIPYKSLRDRLLAALLSHQHDPEKGQVNFDGNLPSGNEEAIEGLVQQPSVHQDSDASK